MSEREDASAKEPTYIAQCPECECLIGCAVAPVNQPQVLRDAVKHRLSWERDGYKVSTVTVRDVREWPSEKAFKHSDVCSKDRRNRRKKPAKQEALAW